MRFVSLIMFFSIAANQLLATQSPEDLLDDKALTIISSPHEAATFFQTHDSYKSQLYLLIVLATELKDQKDSESRIQKITTSLHSTLISNERDNAYIGLVPAKYIHSPESLVNWVSFLSKGASQNYGLMKKPLLLDCKLLEKYPFLLKSTFPVWAYNEEYSPNTNCESYSHRLPESFWKYRNYTKQAMVTEY